MMLALSGEGLKVNAGLSQADVNDKERDNMTEEKEKCFRCSKPIKEKIYAVKVDFAMGGVRGKHKSGHHSIRYCHQPCYDELTETSKRNADRMYQDNLRNKKRNIKSVSELERDFTFDVIMSMVTFPPYNLSAIYKKNPNDPRIEDAQLIGRCLYDVRHSQGKVIIKIDSLKLPQQIVWKGYNL